VVVGEREGFVGRSIVVVVGEREGFVDRSIVVVAVVTVAREGGKFGNSSIGDHLDLTRFPTNPPRMTELVAFGETGLRLSATPGERLEAADRLRVRAVGPESNAAVAARGAGVDATWLSRLPESPLGRRVATGLRGHDLDVVVEWVEPDEEADDSRVGLTFEERASAPRGDATVADHAGAAMADVSMDDVPVPRVERADVAYTTGATPGLSARAATATARYLKAARDGGATTAFALSYHPDRWTDAATARETLTEFFPAVDVLLTSEADAETVLDEPGQPAAVANALAAEYGFETVVVHGGRGATALHGSTVDQVAAVEGDTRDPAGAQDAFAGALCAEFAATEDIEAALRMGVAAAALARTVEGAVPAFTRAEIDRVVAGIDD
jgi:2-dehydro-3-deoxygluconokinase